MEESIAAQLVGYAHPLGQTVDIILGGGRCYFLPKGSSGACRKDSVDLESYAREKGFTVFSNRTAFDSPLKLPYLGLFDSGCVSSSQRDNHILICAFVPS